MPVTLVASEEGINMIDEARKQKHWNKQDSKWVEAVAEITQRGSVSTIKNFLGRKPINAELFKACCQAVEIDWQNVIDQGRGEGGGNVPDPDWSVYDDYWVGREDTVTELQAKVNNSCRLLLILGMTGIGKTALAECLADRLKQEKNWVKIQRQDFENNSGDFLSVAIQWLEYWGEKLTVDDKKDQERLMLRLLKRLESQPYLIILDSVENILEGNEDDGWTTFKDQLWTKFFTQFLSRSNCQSRIILTSQDTPSQIEERYANFYHCYCLGGLNTKEQLELFEKYGFELEENGQNRDYLTRIGAAYEGHPLALRVISGEIGSRPYYGNVSAYWSKYGKEIEEVEKAIAEAKEGIIEGRDNWKLDSFTKKLRESIKKRLEKTFDRLKNEVPHAYQLICRSSIYRCAVTEQFWLNQLMFFDLDDEQKELTLDLLKDRFLVETSQEENRIMLRQHNLVRTVALKHLEAMG